MTRWLGVFVVVLAASCSGTEGASCPQGTTQVGGSCRQTCHFDTDCLSSERCDPSLQLCVAGAATTPDSGAANPDAAADSGAANPDAAAANPDATADSGAANPDATTDSGAAGSDATADSGAGGMDSGAADPDATTDSGAAGSDAAADGGATSPDAAVPTDSGGQPAADAGGAADSGIDAGAMMATDGAVPDSGPPPIPCARDQDCASGSVCDLSVPSGRCRPGRACTRDPECARCFDLIGGNRIDCHHGFAAAAYCNANHGNVCTRELSPCEPCATDAECGALPAILGGANNECLTYANGRFCGRSSTVGCPSGYASNMDGQCERVGGCPAARPVCPAAAAGQGCAGTDQICPGEPCAAGGVCRLNGVPGAIGFCEDQCARNSDCGPAAPICHLASGSCQAACTPGSCGGGTVCHVSGLCGPPCSANTDCTSTLGAAFYCNLPGQAPPRIFKPYRDASSCAPLGCERPVDCPAAGMVCDAQQSPPACVSGCFDSQDCLATEQCRLPGAGGPQPSYTTAQCRALSLNPGAGQVGVCCNPGCTNTALHCGVNQWCCGEVGGPYEDPTSCLSGTTGECFDIAPPPSSPFCHQCMSDADCDSGWTFGYNIDPNIAGGQPFQEQEWCLSVAMGVGMCTVTCNPNLPQSGNIGCPRTWSCQPFAPFCFQDADCSGLPCVGADTSLMPPVPGRCQCGSGGQVAAQCPSVYPNLSTLQNPRCELLGASGEMFCVASHHCVPPPVSGSPGGGSNYPMACLL